jgi:hypothetical protein
MSVSLILTEVKLPQKRSFAMPVTHIGYTLLDAKGKRATTGIKIDSAAYTLAQIAEFASEMGDLIDNISECQVVEATAYISMTPGVALKASPVAGSDVEEGGLFTFSLASSPYVESVRVPGLIQGKFSGAEVNLADADIDAFVDGIVVGLDASGTNVAPLNKFGVNIGAIISAVKSFRK